MSAKCPTSVGDTSTGSQRNGFEPRSAQLDRGTPCNNSLMQHRGGMTLQPVHVDIRASEARLSAAPALADEGPTSETGCPGGNQSLSKAAVHSTTKDHSGAAELRALEARCEANQVATPQHGKGRRVPHAHDPSLRPGGTSLRQTSTSTAGRRAVMRTKYVRKLTKWPKL